MHCADVVLIGRSTREYLLVAETGGLAPEALRSRLVATTVWIEGHPDGVSGRSGAHRTSLAEGDLLRR